MPSSVSCEKGLQWAAALYLFHEMSRIQIAPNHISYNAAISSCEKGPCVFLVKALQTIPNLLKIGIISWQQKHPGYPLVICYIAIENGPVEIVDLPTKNGDFSMVM